MVESLGRATGRWASSEELVKDLWIPADVVLKSIKVIDRVNFRRLRRDIRNHVVTVEELHGPNKPGVENINVTIGQISNRKTLSWTVRRVEIGPQTSNLLEETLVIDLHRFVRSRRHLMYGPESRGRLVTLKETDRLVH